MAWCSCPVNSLLFTSNNMLTLHADLTRDICLVQNFPLSHLHPQTWNQSSFCPGTAKRCMFGWYRLCMLASFPWTSSFLRLTQNDAVPPQTSCTHIYKWVREFRSDFRSELALLAVTMFKLVTSPLRELQPLNMAALNKKMEKER